MNGARFFFADSLDYVDPGYDFAAEEHRPDRRPQRDDVYPHEFFGGPPYDGILISRAVVGDEKIRGKYTTSQAERFRRDGASAFLRYDPAAVGGAIMGDCGAFSYVRRHDPPYSVSDMVDYYEQCGFTHGVSIDHVILGYDERVDRKVLLDADVDLEWKRRYDLTLRLAEEFLTCCRRRAVHFQPIGVAQAWSPRSYAEAARRLVDVGYDYIGLGGLVPRKADQIRRILEAVREVAPSSIRLHLFGFTKVDDVEISDYGVTSFDSTAPMTRAFKDDRCNYLALDGEWYTAIRVPHADENRRLKEQILAGRVQHRQLRDQEREALRALRAYGAGRAELEESLEPVVTYGLEFVRLSRERGSAPQSAPDPQLPVEAGEGAETAKVRHLGRERERMMKLYRRTLEARPWERCPCRVCVESGIEVIIFRGNNRNRRRGFHNLWAFHQRLRARCDQAEEVLAHAV